MLWSRGVPLLILPSPYRSLIDPILAHIDRLQAQEPNCQITIVVPEFVPQGWWAKLLHGNAGIVVLLRLRYRQGVAVTNIPYHIKAYVKPAEGNDHPDEDFAAGNASAYRAHDSILQY
jgi:hypothetical protein